MIQNSNDPLRKSLKEIKADSIFLTDYVIIILYPHQCSTNFSAQSPRFRLVWPVSICGTRCQKSFWYYQHLRQLLYYYLAHQSRLSQSIFSFRWMKASFRNFILLHCVRHKKVAYLQKLSRTFHSKVFSKFSDSHVRSKFSSENLADDCLIERRPRLSM